MPCERIPGGVVCWEYAKSLSNILKIRIRMAGGDPDLLHFCCRKGVPSKMPPTAIFIEPRVVEVSLEGEPGVSYASRKFLRIWALFMGEEMVKETAKEDEENDEAGDGYDAEAHDADKPE